MRLRRQGFYKEMPHGEESDLSILEFVEKNEEKNLELICQYLKEGEVLVACGGVVRDIINPDNGIAGCPDMMTDGIWLWPGDLAYYVKQYHLRLSDEFIRIMRESNWHVNEILSIDYNNIEII